MLKIGRLLQLLKAIPVSYWRQSDYVHCIPFCLLLHTYCCGWSTKNQETTLALRELTNLYTSFLEQAPDFFITVCLYLLKLILQDFYATYIYCTHPTFILAYSNGAGLQLYEVIIATVVSLIYSRTLIIYRDEQRVQFLITLVQSEQDNTIDFTEALLHAVRNFLQGHPNRIL
jgi:hypothetical protein